jgi:hypothetical protein
MDRRLKNTQPLRERIMRLGQEAESLHRAISEELDWREKARPVDLDDWDDDE